MPITSTNWKIDKVPKSTDRPILYLEDYIHLDARSLLLSHRLANFFSQREAASEQNRFIVRAIVCLTLLLYIQYMIVR